VKSTVTRFASSCATLTTSLPPSISSAFPGEAVSSTVTGPENATIVSAPPVAAIERIVTGAGGGGVGSGGAAARAR
jgi:hypothetical protein